MEKNAEPRANEADEVRLEPGRASRRELTAAVAEYLHEFVEGRTHAPASHPPATRELFADLMAPPSEAGADIEPLLAQIAAAADTGIETASGRHLSFIPSGGLYTSALAHFIGAVMNRYTGGCFGAPGSVAIEQGVVRWLLSLFDYPPAARGILLSGASIANLTAIVTARDRLGDDFRDGTLYLSERAHHSLSKAARIAGIANDRIRVVAVDRALRMDMDALRTAIEGDLVAGLRPMLIAATAGTTDTGAIDPLDECSVVARESGAWLHVDAAYGGFFVLTGRGRRRLSGIRNADSIAVDAHKSLFLPFGIGALLVRHGDALVAAHAGRGSYMQDVQDDDELPNYFALGPELTRPFRGLALWLPLHLHGVHAFRVELDRMLDLAESTSDAIEATDGLELATDTALSIVSFRCAAGDAASKQLLERLNESRELHVSSTTVAGRFTLRIAFLSQRTTTEVAARTVELIRLAMNP